MASDNNEQTARRRFFKPYGWDQCGSPNRTTTDDHWGSPEPETSDNAEPVFQFEPTIDPEEADEHHRLTAAVGRHLVQVAVEPKPLREFAALQDETREALRWLAEHPHAIAMFLLGGHWHKQGSELRRFRGSLLFRKPVLSGEQTVAHRIVLGGTAGQVLDFLTSADGGRHVPRLEPHAAKTLAGALLEHLQFAFTETGSPLFVWAAFRTARRNGQPVPDWVLSFLDDCAGRVSDLAATQPDRIGREAARAFGFAAMKPGPNPAVTEARKLRAHLAVYAFLRERRAHLKTLEEAINEAEDRFGMSRSTVFSVYKEVNELLAVYQNS